MATQKKLLIIYYNFPPVKVPGAVRIHHFYKAALPHFQDIQVLTTRNRQFFQQDESLETGCRNIHEVPAWDLRRLTARKKTENKPFVSPALKERPLVRWLRRLVDSFPFNILIGDGGLVYILMGYLRARQLIQQEGITYVFSTFRPYSDHIIGHLLKRRFPQLYWIADFRDLHVDPVLKNTFCPPFQRWCNRQVLRRADLVTTVSEGLKRHLERLAPRVEVLRNGISPVDETAAPGKSFEKFTIVYTGSLFEDRRDPGLLFSSLQKMLATEQLHPESIQILYAGRDEKKWMAYAAQYNLGPITKCLGMRSITEARLLQSNAALNLLLTYTTPQLTGNLTGKLMEYFAAQRPILALVNGTRDEEMEQIFKQLNAGVVAYTTSGSPTTVEHFISKTYQRWQLGGEQQIPLPQPALKRLEWPNMMNRLMQLIEQEP